MNYLRLLCKLYRKKQMMKKSKEQVHTLQENKLRKLLLYAYEHSAYYRETFEAAGITANQINTAPLEQFPTLNKELLMEHYDEIVTDTNVKQSELRSFGEKSSDSMDRYLGKYHVVHSSGSTGVPRYFLYDEQAWEEVIISVICGALWELSFRDILKLLAKNREFSILQQRADATEVLWRFMTVFGAFGQNSVSWTLTRRFQNGLKPYRNSDQILSSVIPPQLKYLRNL